MASLYNKYRPHDWNSVVDQDGAIVPIKRQICDGKPAHAYLLVGTHGTGKTTTAKIISRAVNCLEPHEGSPCGVCSNCMTNSLDIIELDAASNNGVDNIRGIIESSAYHPADLKYKVYIIDEVHMLSKGAFNALLKTLEDPPEYCIFILATTELNKVPATIRSRCQKYEFKRISLEAMVQRMEFICKTEGFSYEKDALNLIGLNADGALRDCLSMLEQAIFVSDGNITADAVTKMIGCTDKTALIEFTKYIVVEDIKEVMFSLQTFIKSGKEMSTLMSDVLQILRDIMVVQVASDYVLENTKEYLEAIQECALSFMPKRITFLVTRINKILNKVSYSLNPVITVENELMLMFHGINEEIEETLMKLMAEIEEIKEIGVSIYGPVSKQMTGEILTDISCKPTKTIVQRTLEGVKQVKISEGVESKETDRDTVDIHRANEDAEWNSFDTSFVAYEENCFEEKFSTDEQIQTTDEVQLGYNPIETNVQQLCDKDVVLKTLMNKSKVEFDSEKVKVYMDRPLVPVFVNFYSKLFEEYGIKMEVFEV